LQPLSAKECLHVLRICKNLGGTAKQTFVPLYWDEGFFMKQKTVKTLFMNYIRTTINDYIRRNTKHEEQLNSIRVQAEQELSNVGTIAELENIRVKYLGKKGNLPPY